MNKVLNAIKCHDCRETLKSPILLPCGHSMCKQHADESGDQVKCPKCGVSHQNQGFVVMLDLLDIIESEIASIDFGPGHKEAKEACDKLEDILSQIDVMIKDPMYISRKAIDELKNQILLKREQLKLEIDENAEKLLAILSDYQHKCELNFKESNFEPSIKNLKNIKKEIEKILKESFEVLNKLKVDDGKWTSIKQACERKIVDLNNYLESFKKLTMDKFEDKKYQVGCFVDVDLSPFFRMEFRIINSAILNDEQKYKLREICKINPYKKWTLLYRGSRDGFGAHSFHSKCDNIPKTLTIIETTQGFIFGGYTELTWNGTGWGADPKAYLFSLVNEVNSSFVMKIKEPEKAIFAGQLYGPIFGTCVNNICDIFIRNNSNITSNSSRIFSYCLPDEYKDRPHILSGSETFKVKEIELFELE